MDEAWRQSGSDSLGVKGAARTEGGDTDDSKQHVQRRNK